MEYIRDVTSTLWDSCKSIAVWCDDYEGLGAWVGSIGAIIAIFVAWGLARSEYRRTRRESIHQKLRQIDMLQGVIFVARDIIAEYERAAKKSRIHARSFYELHLQDHELRLMNELSSLPLTGWPNPMLALSFRPYWQAATNVLESSRADTNFDSLFAKAVDEYEKKSKELDDMFGAERLFIKHADSF
jgi:hypothetical protein